MRDQLAIFLAAAGAVDRGGMLPADPPAVEFLVGELGYRADLETAPAAVKENRAAVLRAACRVSNLFRLASPDAPGARIWCGTADPAVLGPAFAGREPASVAGCGVTDGRALEGCVGEAVEYLSQFGLSDELRFGVAQLRRVADLDRLVADGDELVRGSALASREPVAVPASLFLRDHGRSVDPAFRVGNGCAAGRNATEAQLAALLELIERHAIALWWYRDGTAAQPDRRALDAFQETLAAYRGDASARATTLLPISSDVEVSVLAAISFRSDGSSFAAGFGAHPDPAEAARHAVRELVQMEMGIILVEAKEAALGAQRLNEHDMRIQARARLVRPDHPKLRPERRARVPIPVDASLPAEAMLAQIVDGLSRRGMSAYAVDLTRASLLLPVASVCVPGLLDIPPDAGWPLNGDADIIPLF